MSEVEFIEIFGDNLRSMLEELGVSQNRLAKETGIDKGSISRFINKTRMPSLKSLINICHCLDCKLDDLVPTYDMID